VDDISTNRIVLKVKLGGACYETVQAGTGAGALALARTMRPDLALIDLRLPDMDGLELCRRLRADPATRAIPLIALSSVCGPAERLAALRAGADEAYAKPVDDAILMARMRSLLRAREQAEELGLRSATYREFGLAEAPSPLDPPARIAVVPGPSALAERWAAALSEGLPDRVAVLPPENVLGERAGAGAADLYVIPADMAEPGDGLRLMSELRSRHATRHSAVCIVLPPGGTDAAAVTGAIALDLGAQDLIAPDAPAEEIVHRAGVQIARKRQADRLRASVADGLRLAMTDALTGLHNRRYAEPHLARIAAHAAAAGRRFAVMVIDIDRFKAVNDTLGHAAGDAVLVEVAARLKGNLRAVDLIARIGGEEFLIALPDTTLEAARGTAERLRRIVADTAVRLPGGGSAKVTISVGLAMGGAGESDGETGMQALVARADRALLAAKSDGRDRVTVSLSAA
jgi:two-component system cell cycle response regulator